MWWSLSRDASCVARRGLVSAMACFTSNIRQLFASKSAEKAVSAVPPSSACVTIRQHTSASAYVSIRHTFASRAAFSAASDLMHKA
jgi:hypothetical protein